jgi:hypothetical protein
MMRGAAEGVAHLFRRRVGGDVEILGLLADQQVAHGAADHIGLEAFFLKGFAFAEGRRATRFAGKTAVLLRWHRGDQVRDAEFAGDRASDKTVGGGNHGTEIAGFQMLLHQRFCRGRHHRANAGSHEVSMPGVQLGARVAGEGLQLEIEKLVDVQRTGLVLLVELAVLRLV